MVAISIPGVYSKTKKLASGQSRTYYYHRKSKARLPNDPHTPEFMARVQELNRNPGKPVLHATCFAMLVEDYLHSDEYARKAKYTKVEYRRHINYLRDNFGAFDVSVIGRKHQVKVMDKLKDTLSKAVGVARMLSILMTRACALGWVAVNPLVGSKLPKAGDGQLPYEEWEIQEFRARNPYGTRARLTFELLLASAVRIADAAKASSNDLRAGIIRIISQKTGVPTYAKATNEVMLAFEAWEAACNEAGQPLRPYALGGANGRPLHKRTVSKDMEEAFDRAQMRVGQRSHALRYTACVRLFENGYTYDRIADVAGHRMAVMAKKYCDKKRAAPATVALFNKIDAAADAW